MKTIFCHEYTTIFMDILTKIYGLVHNIKINRYTDCKISLIIHTVRNAK